MTEMETKVLDRALEMRRDFDSAFAKPIRLDETLTQKFLAIRAGGQPCVIRLSAIAGLYADKKITPVPGGHPALRGIAGFRGTILPVYDLARLVGASPAPTSRWLVIAKATTKAAPVALGFESFEAQLLAQPDAIVAQPAAAEMRGFSHEFLRTAEFSGPILHLPSVLDAIGTSQHGDAVN